MPKSRQRDSQHSPRFCAASHVHAAAASTEWTASTSRIVGVPFDSGTSYRSGARLGPREIRAQSSLIRPYSYFQKVSPFDDSAGRRRRRHRRAAGRQYRSGVRRDRGRAFGAIAQAGAVPIVAGGDHSISLPMLRAVAGKHGPVALVQFDAHIDTWGDYFGGRYFHGSPFRRAIEEGLLDRRRLRAGRHPRPDVRRGGRLRVPECARRVDDRHRQGEDDGVAAHDRADPERRRVRSTSRSISIPSIRRSRRAPARPRSGGLTSYEAQELVRGLAGLDLVGCDVVEVAPQFDGPGQITRCSGGEPDVRVARASCTTGRDRK